MDIFAGRRIFIFLGFLLCLPISSICVDSDNDGLPDEWEYAHFGSLEVDGRVTNIVARCIVGSNNNVKLIIAYPENFSNRLDVFSCLNPDLLSWKLELNTNVNPQFARTVCDYFLSATNRFGYYLVGNAGYDTDGDELGDSCEILVFKTSPTNPDTDSDVLPDGWEYKYFGDPTNGEANVDTDSDGWTNVVEYKRGGNPAKQWIADTNNVLKLRIITPIRE